MSWAAENGHEAVVGQLLEKGLTWSMWDNYGRMPLLLTAENGHEAVVGQLLETGLTW